jgi:hypothetical protein
VHQGHTHDLGYKPETVTIMAKLPSVQHVQMRGEEKQATDPVFGNQLTLSGTNQMQA